MNSLFFVAASNKVGIATVEENISLTLVANFGVAPELIMGRAVKSADAPPVEGIVVKFDDDLYADALTVVEAMSMAIPEDVCSIQRDGTQPAVFEVSTRAATDVEKVIEKWKKANLLYQGRLKKFVSCIIFEKEGDGICVCGSYIPKNDRDYFDWRARVKSLCLFANLGRPEFEDFKTMKF